MARFILDINIPCYPKIEKELCHKAIEDIIWSGVVQEYAHGITSMTCIDYTNTAQFWEETHRNCLTKKQIRKFNENPHG